MPRRGQPRNLRTALLLLFAYFPRILLNGRCEQSRACTTPACAHTGSATTAPRHGAGEWCSPYRAVNKLATAGNRNDRDAWYGMVYSTLLALACATTPTRAHESTLQATQTHKHTNTQTQHKTHVCVHTRAHTCTHARAHTHLCAASRNRCPVGSRHRGLRSASLLDVREGCRRGGGLRAHGGWAGE